MARSYAGHMNMMLIMKCLLRKGYIGDEVLKARVDECLKERADQQGQLKQHDTNFDEVDTVLNTAMKLKVFAELELISDECVMRQLCIDCDRILLKKSLDSMENRTFLGKVAFALRTRYQLNRIKNSLIVIFVF